MVTIKGSQDRGCDHASPTCKDAKLGAQIGTTSLDAINDQIKPTTEPTVFQTNDAAVQALQNGQIDGLVVDLPTAFYMTVGAAGRRPDRRASWPVNETNPEQFGLLLEKGSSLTACVSAAVDALRADGTLAALREAVADGGRRARPEVVHHRSTVRRIGQDTVTARRDDLDTVADPAAARSPIRRRRTRALGVDRRGIDGGPARRRRAGAGQHPRLAEVPRGVLRRLLRLAGAARTSPKGLWLNIRLMVVCEIFILILAMLIALVRTLRGPVFFPIRVARDDLHRPVPRAAADPGAAAARVSACRACGCPGCRTVRAVLGRDRH